MSTTTDGIDTARQPTRLASILAIGAAYVGVWQLGVSPLILGVAGSGVTVFTAGNILIRRGQRLSGVVVTVAGIGTCTAALVLATTSINQLSGYFSQLPSILCLFVLGATLAPIDGTGSRKLVRVGTGLLYVAMLVAAVFQTVPFARLLIAAIAAIVAWDAGEHAISLGDHLGRQAKTAEVEIVHVAGSAGVAVLAIVAIWTTSSFGYSGVLLMLLASTIVTGVLLVVTRYS